MKQRTITIPPEHLFPADEWRIVEGRWTPDFAARAETAMALSNGYLGVRGTPDEGRPAFAPGTFINGFHETWPITHAEDAYGLARVGQTIVNVPDATIIELYVDDEPLFLPTARTPEYLRVLDMRNGVLTRDLLWSTPSGKHARVRSTRLVSFEHRHVVAISYEVTMDRRAPVMIRSRIVNRANPVEDESDANGDQADPRLGTRLGRRVLEPRLVEHEANRLVLGYQTVQSGMTLAVGVDHLLDVPSPHHVSMEADPDASEFVVSVDAEPDVPIRVEKYAVYQSSRSVAVADLARRCRYTLDRVTAAGFESLVAEQRSCLDRFWDRADVTLEDTVTHPVRMQQAVRWNVFHLAQASWRAEGAGIPAKGLTGDAYDGHYFWDTEAWVLPFLAYTQPRIARNLLRFRHSMLASARARAQRARPARRTVPVADDRRRRGIGVLPGGYRSVPSQRRHRLRDPSLHRRAGRHGLHRRDRSRDPRRDGTDVGRSRLLRRGRQLPHPRCHRSRRVHDDGRRQRLHEPDGAPQPALRGVDDATPRRPSSPSVYAAIAEELELDASELDEWDRAADQMHIPHDPTRGITPQDATFLTHEPWDLEHTPPDRFPLLLHSHPLTIYRHQVLKQADVVMAMFLLGNEFTLDQKRRNFEYYDPITTGDSSLSASIQSIVASEIGNEEAACRYLDFALMMDLADVAGNVSSGVHIASAAGGWMGLVFGFGGVRDFDGRPHDRPPPTVSGSGRSASRCGSTTVRSACGSPTTASGTG